MAVWDGPLTRGNPVISVMVVGKAREDNRNARRWQIVPWPVIVRCSVPVPIIRTVPVSGLEKELETDIRREICVTAWNRVDSGRCRHYDCGKTRNPYSYPYMKIYITGYAFSRQQKTSRTQKKQTYGNYEKLFAHVSLLYYVIHEFKIRKTCEGLMKKL
jgi:hypothetical protein